MARMLHQIQSDIKVKQELVSHLEKSETEYAFMRRKFDDKIAYFQSQLSELQRERDEALDRTKSRFSSNKSNKVDVALQQREKQQLIDIRHAYEAKMKHLLCEIQDLRRKYSQMTSTMQATRNQNETLLRSLRANVETLQVEKKRMVKRMKAEAERVREQMSTQERRIHQLQRLQAEANMAKQRLEREHENQKLMLKKRGEEIMVNQAQLKQLVNVLKKAVREGGVLDERLLGRVSHIVGGSFAIVARRGGFGYSSNTNGRRSHRGAKRVNPIPVQVRATRKKELLDKALGQFIQGKQAVAEMEQLLVRRERLATEKVELLEERKQIYMAEKENADSTGEPMDTMAIELMDERIDLMSAEISYLSARIRALQSEAAGDDTMGQSDENNNTHGGTTNSRVEKHVTFADEIITDPQPTDEWADMDAFEEHYNVPSNAAPEVAYDVTVKLLKSLETDECRRITEALVDDLMSLRMNECNRQSMQQNLEKTVMDLRRTLIVMKRAAIATTVENERRIRKLEELRDGGVIDRSKSPIDVKIEEYINGGNTIFDKIYEDGIRGLINTTPEPGMEDEDDHVMSSHSSNGDIITGGSSSGSSVVSSGTLSTGDGGSSRSSGGERGSPKPPKSLRVNKTPVPGGQRETTPSPDRFYNMIQKRLSWQQQRTGGSESPVPITMISPAEFARYTADRDSSTSSIRSNHLRRSSVQSDFSSSLNSWNNTSSSSSLQHHRKPRHRASLRELSQEGLFEQYPPPLPPSSPLANYSTQSRQQYRRQTIPMVEHRSMTPNNGNVFDRLAQTPTRASRAKMSSQRHSSGSFEELRQRWDNIQQERVDSPAAVY
ncbi:hypothetical protein K492DRAFT_61515 [Lichtheimia hyalospora FSU 10163]|nr:hypothetical protein K492DRAFT_61515 [Lichtheimia hyalospora FSU 10163]